MLRTTSGLFAALALIACAEAPTAPTARSAAFARTLDGGGGATSARTPFSAVVANPCTGEVVDLSGMYHVVVGTTSDASGGTHVISHSNFQGLRGVAVPSGRRYVLVETDHRTANASADGASEMTDVTVFRMISQGSLDDWWVQMVVHVTVNANGETTATVDRVDGGCRG